MTDWAKVKPGTEIEYILPVPDAFHNEFIKVDEDYPVLIHYRCYVPDIDTWCNIRGRARHFKLKHKVLIEV
jgi:hypothetical protein